MSEVPLPKPIVTVDTAPDGRPLGAEATAEIAAPRDRVWAFILNVDGYPGIVPMLHKVKRDGDRVTVHLKFKVALLSVGFDFTCDVSFEEGRWLELRWVSGEPKGMRIRFDLDEIAGGCRVRAGIWFDPFSLGWLAKVFLKHHPEIQYGIFPGCALAIVDSIRKVAEAA
jgi:ribosome-associated toxin RatA of RatAB toxin-antitoxin module